MNFSKIAILSGLLLIIGWTSYNMYAAAAAQSLWGYRPLVLLLAGWAVLALLFYRPNHLLLYATLCGVLLGAGFPGWLPLPFLMFGAFVPLLMTERLISQQYQRPQRGQIFRYSFYTFMLWNILSTWWIANSSLAAGIFAIIANSLLMTLPWVLAYQTRLVMPRLGYAPLVAYWLVFEYLHYRWELNYPWLTLGNAFAQLPALVQWYEFTGVFGGSLWVLLANVLLFDSIKLYRDKRLYRQALWKFTALILIPTGISLFQYFSFASSGNNAEIIVVQPNYEPHYEEDKISEAQKLARCLELAAAQMTPNTDFLIFPEATFGFVETHQMSEYAVFLRLWEWMQAYPRLHIVSGVNAYHIFQPDETPSAAARTSRSDPPFQYEALNAAIQLSPHSRQMQLHRKSRLVPGPEHFPFRRQLAFLQPIVQRLGGTTAGLGIEQQPVIFENETARIAPLICYESVFGEYVAAFGRKGAAIIFIMTNDGWWDDTPGHRQHLYFASLRAIETRRSIARAANTGISAFINARGDILQKTRYNEATAIRARLPLSFAPTFYMRWGDMIGRLALFAAAIFALNMIVRRFQPKSGI